MSKKRDYIKEILEKKGRHHIRAAREEQFRRRVIPLVSGFRSLKSLKRTVTFRDEWLKYGAIGYIACVEGYFKRLFADLIDYGPPYADNLKDFNDVTLKLDAVAAIQSDRVSLGEFISHLLPISSVSDINHHMSTLIGKDFLELFFNEPASEFNPRPIKDVHPEIVVELEDLFKLRHMFCHELATKIKVPVRRIESGISAAAGFVIYTEDIAKNNFMKT